MISYPAFFIQRAVGMLDTAYLPATAATVMSWNDQHFTFPAGVGTAVKEWDKASRC